MAPSFGLGSRALQMSTLTVSAGVFVQGWNPGVCHACHFGDVTPHRFLVVDYTVLGSEWDIIKYVFEDWIIRTCVFF